MPTKQSQNSQIAQRIHDARKQTKLTQQDLAKHLKRTSAAISDLERGKVQISATDLYKLAHLLKRPIEWFYGEEFGGDDVRDLIFVLRRTPAQTRKAMLPGLTYSLRLIEIGEQIRTITDEQEAFRLIAEYRAIMQSAAEQQQALSSTMTAQYQDIQAKLTEVLSAAKVVLPTTPEIHLPGLKRTTKSKAK